MQPRRFALVAASLGIALAVGSTAFVKHRKEARTLSQALELVGQFEQDLAAIDYVRDPAGGSGVAGRAWDGYGRALAGLAQVSRDEVIRLSLAALAAAETSAEERVELGEKLLQPLVEELDAIRSGARSLDATPAGPGVSIEQGARPTLFGANCLTDALTVLGLSEIEQGDAAEGAAMVLDAMQCAQDFIRSPILITQMIGNSQLVPRSLEAFGEHQGLGRLDPVALALLDAGVARLLSSTPWLPELRGDLAAFHKVWSADPANRAAGFGKDMSAGLLQLTTVLDGERDRCPKTLCLDLYELARGSEKDSWLGLSAGPYASAIVSQRYNVVRLGMLHYALRRARGKEPLEFVDPFGLPLEVTIEGDVLVLKVDRPRFTDSSIEKRYRL